MTQFSMKTLEGTKWTKLQSPADLRKSKYPYKGMLDMPERSKGSRFSRDLLEKVDKY